MISYDVIIPHFNNPIKLKRAIRSVLKQKFLPKNILVVDDKSDQTCIAKIESYIEEYSILNLIKMDENKGPGAARNIGLKNSQAEYIAFLDADDIFAENKIEIIANILLEFPNLGYFGHYYDLIDQNIIEERIVKNLNVNYFSAIMKNPAQTSCVFIKNISLFFEESRYCEDHQFFYRYIFIARNFANLDCIIRTESLTYIDRPQGSLGGLSGEIFKMRIGIIHAQINDLFLFSGVSLFLFFSALSQIPRHIIKLLIK